MLLRELKMPDGYHRVSLVVDLHDQAMQSAKSPGYDGAGRGHLHPCAPAQFFGRWQKFLVVSLILQVHLRQYVGSDGAQFKRTCVGIHALIIHSSNVKNIAVSLQSLSEP